jgi:hypothetical protein
MMSFYDLTSANRYCDAREAECDPNCALLALGLCDGCDPTPEAFTEGG